LYHIGKNGDIILRKSICDSFYPIAKKMKTARKKYIKSSGKTKEFQLYCSKNTIQKQNEERNKLRCYRKAEL
jgi:hypothetical protein